VPVRLMTALLKKSLPYLLTSLVVIGLGRLFTMTDNYAWHPKGKELLLLQVALGNIFIYKTAFWLVVANGIVFIAGQLFRDRYKPASITLVSLLTFYVLAKPRVDRLCAPHYYTIFVNQSVSEEYLEHPIKEAGYHIGPILTEKIRDKEMPLRLYAIDGLGTVRYKPATETLRQILFDTTESDELRATTFLALKKFRTKDANDILTSFDNLSRNTSHERVLELIKNWEKSN
jgi:hypothetical protein